MALTTLFILLLPPTTQILFASVSIIEVSTAAELKQALEDVQPGQTIQLADGVYAAEFEATVSGTITQPIALQGSAQAILDRGAIQGGHGLYLDHVDYWNLTGFTIRNAAKGIMLDHADHNRLDHLYIHTIGQEAIHFRSCSAFNLLQNSEIRNTGVITPGFGEGVYIGSDRSDWLEHSCDADGRDKSNSNRVVNNIFGPDVRAEAIDIKEGTLGGKIIGNHFDATGLSGENYADSWVDVKGNNYEVAHNVGQRGENSSLLHGFEIHEKVTGWGRDNLFYDNIAQVDADGYGFHIDTNDANHGNKVCADNQVYGAGKGVTNITISGVPHSVIAANSSRLTASPQPTITGTLWLPLIGNWPC